MKSLKFRISILLSIILVLTVCISTSSESNVVYDTYKDAPTAVADCSVFLADRELSLGEPIYFVTGRLFIPLVDFMEKIGASVTSNYDNFEISYDGAQFTLDRENDEKLMRALFYKNDCCYISLIDLSELLNLAVTFDCAKKKLSFWYRDALSQPPENSGDMKRAYLRLEDVGAKMNDSGEELEKFRVMIDYLYERGQSFYIAWIPLFVDPPRGIYNDLTTDFNLYNACFIYTLDYAVAHGAGIVLHGYTHQENDTISGIGTEFGSSSPYTLSQINARMQAAKYTAAKLGFDNSIFEFPHYASTQNQLRLAENNFDVIYQQEQSSKKNIGKIVRKRAFPYMVKYVPTPIGYIQGEAALPGTLAAIDALPEDQLTSMFMHPYLDFSHVRCATENGKRIFYYDENSILAQLVNKITEKGMVFSEIE